MGGWLQQQVENVSNTVATIGKNASDDLSHGFQSLDQGYVHARDAVTQRLGLWLYGSPREPGAPPPPVALRGTDDTPEDSSVKKDDNNQLRAFAEAGKTVSANPLVGDGTIGQGATIAARAPLGRNMLIGN